MYQEGAVLGFQVNYCLNLYIDVILFISMILIIVMLFISMYPHPERLSNIVLLTFPSLLVG